MISAAMSLPDLVPLGSASDYLEDILEVLQPHALFEGFSPKECGELCQYLECFGAPSHVTIIREGDAGDFLLVVLTGLIQVVKRDAGGEAKVVAEVGPGAFLGEMSLIDGRARFASCVSAAPSDLAVLSRERLNAILVDHPRLGQKLLLMLLRHTVGRLRETTARMLPLMDGVAV
jgi:CRP/FNR family transcriptional regulator, cyclic AMP receptor protein